MTYRISVETAPSGEAACESTALERAVARVTDDLASGRLPALSVARNDDDLPALDVVATRITGSADAVLVLGTGGSSLAGQALEALAGPDATELVFADNIDPHFWSDRLPPYSPFRLHVLAVSKSGNTAETMAQLLLIGEWMAGHGRLAADWLTAVTEPGPRPLRDYAAAHGATILDHPAAIGGRFSALSLTGLLPALIAGLDARAVRRGASHVLDDLEANGVDSAPARAARMAVAAESAHADVQVLLPYADRLGPFARWWVQLWGESLGKSGRGSTPVAARGATDQHSQLQLWRDGTRHHMVTVLGVDTAADSPAIKTADPDLSYLNGRTLGDLFRAERDATIETLRAVGVPVRTLALERLDEEAMGALFAHFMVETILVAHMIGVDPFVQPAVEDGKQRTREALKAMAR